MSRGKLIQPDLDFVKEITAQGGGESLKKCYQCATCSVVCNVTHTDKPFPRKEMIWAQWGLKDKLLGDPDVWLCHQCSDCTAYCPRGAKPGEVLGAIRKLSIKENSWAGAIAKLVGSPAGLIPLLLIPVIIFAAIILGLGRLDHLEGKIVFEKLVPIPAVDAVFITAALFAAVSFLAGIKKYWRLMHEASGLESTRGSVIPAITGAVLEIIGHKRFGKCDVTSSRSLSHKMVFWGFVGLAITTTWAVIYLYILNIPGPYPITDPMKWLALASMASLLLGIFLVFMNRLSNAEKAGKGSYFDWQFIWLVVLVALTGALSWGLRLAGTAELAYITYFSHLTFVFCLFAYAPFSKMAHMVYRATAMVFARHVNMEGTK